MHAYGKLPPDTTVTFYSGYKNSETPRSVVIHGQPHQITEIQSRQRLMDPNTHEVMEVFVCKTQYHSLKITKHANGKVEVSSKDNYNQ